MIKDKRSLDATITALYNIIWGQCSKLLKNKLLAIKDFEEEIGNECNASELLKEIRQLTNVLEENVSLYDSLDQAKRKFYSYHQNEEESNAQHMVNFRNAAAIVEYYGATYSSTNRSSNTRGIETQMTKCQSNRIRNIKL